MSEVAEALIITAGVIVTQIGIAWRTNNVIKMRLDLIEKKQDKHNNLIERMALAELRLEHVEDKIK